MSEEPIQPDVVDEVTPDESAAEPLDENLAALARAEGEVEAVAAHLVERRRRGRPAWGWVSLFLALAGLLWPVASGTLTGFLKQPGLRWDRGQIVEAAILAGAIVFGTIGRRRLAGRRPASIGRLVALCIPPVAWLLVAAVRTYRGVADGDLVIASATALVWLACGLFAFATFDALLEP